MCEAHRALYVCYVRTHHYMLIHLIRTTHPLTLLFHSELFIHLQHWVISHKRIFYPHGEDYIFKTFLKATSLI